MIAVVHGFVVGLAILGAMVICAAFMWATLRRPMEEERRAAVSTRRMARLRPSRTQRGGSAPPHREATRP